MALFRYGLSDICGAAGIAVVAAMVFAVPARAAPVCSVFDNQPCAPTVCSVFQDGPCIPEIEYPIGQDLRLTIESKGTSTDAAARAGPESQGELNSIAELFAALRACWVPPAMDEASPGLQMSVRFAFKRTGEIIGTPRVTYVTPETPADVRERYHSTISQALARCTPMSFTKGMGGAVAGRPIAIRFVDNRSTDAAAATIENSK
jgi:hypothetical protein